MRGALSGLTAARQHVGAAPDFARHQVLPRRFPVCLRHRTHVYPELPGKLPIRGQAFAGTQLTRGDAVRKRLDDGEVSGLVATVEVRGPHLVYQTM